MNQEKVQDELLRYEDLTTGSAYRVVRSTNPSFIGSLVARLPKNYSKGGNTLFLLYNTVKSDSRNPEFSTVILSSETLYVEVEEIEIIIK